jgi:hypothetical protein
MLKNTVTQLLRSAQACLARGTRAKKGTKILKGYLMQIIPLKERKEKEI